MEKQLNKGESNSQNNNCDNEVVSLRDWIITLILTAIPVVGFICLLVWIFSENTPINKKNWAKANLIIMVAFAVIGIIALILFGGLIASAMDFSSGY